MTTPAPFDTVPFYQVDAFATATFSGNPAAVCVLPAWPADQLLAAVAAENNLSETAFLVLEEDGWRVRWFTPGVEVDLCGHATLAAAHVAYAELGVGDVPLVLASRSGPLAITPLGDAAYRMDFPSVPSEPVAAPAGLAEGLGATPDAVFQAGPDLLAVFPDDRAIRGLAPDFAVLGAIEARGIIATAPGGGEDFCSRFFGPAVDVPEDPVTGSAHCALAPFWADRLGRPDLSGAQLSARGGVVRVSCAGDRVLLEGRCITVITGEFRLP